MKLIFIKNVGGVAQAGAVKDIADGYALNFLIPRGLAVQATPDAVAKHAAHEKAVNAEHQREQEANVALVKGLEGKRVEIKAKATEKGGLFKAISAADVVKALGVALPTGSLHLPDHLKHVGEYVVPVSVSGVTATITVVVTATT